MAITIPPVPEGIIDPNDLCNGVYNEDDELRNLAWANPRLHAAIQHIERQSGAKIILWGSHVNPGANGAPSLRLSTFARWLNRDLTYIDADVRNIYRTPLSVIFALFEISNPGKAMPQLQPFVYEVEAAGPSPLGAEIVPSRMPFRTWENTHQATKAGDTYEQSDGRYEAMEIMIRSGFFGTPPVTKIVWFKRYVR